MEFAANFNSETNFSDDQIHVLLLTNQIISGISIFCSFIVIIIYWYFKNIKYFIFDLVLWLCISNILYCFTAYLPYQDANKTWCGIQAFSILTFQFSSWIISCIIGYSSFISVIKKDHFENNRTLYKSIFIMLTILISTGLASM
jgi:hypothetical protein